MDRTDEYARLWVDKQKSLCEEREQTCFVREIDTGKLRGLFVRLDMGKINTNAITSFDCEAMVDLDENGKVIGITIDWLTEGS